MSDFELEITMPDEYRKLLLELVNSAKKEKVISVIWVVHVTNTPIFYLSYTIGQKQINDLQFPEDPMPGFEALGFFKKLEQEKAAKQHEP